MLSTLITAVVHISIGLGASIAVIDITNTIITTVSSVI